jgi:protease IV
MSHRSFFFTFFIALASLVLYAQEPGQSMADPRSLWEYQANPAAWTLSGDTAALGFRSDFDLDGLSASAIQGQPLDLVIGLPGALYRYTESEGMGAQHAFTSSFNIGKGFAFGWRFRTPDFAPGNERYDLGLMLRPNGLVSIGVGRNDLASSDGGWDLGLGLRPLAFAGTDMADILTLSADARYAQDAFYLDTLTARLSLDEGLQLKAWYAPQSSSFGLGLRLAYRAAEASIETGDLTRPELVRAGLALRVNERVALKPSIAARKGALLVIDFEESASVPYRMASFGGPSSLKHDMLIEAVERAAKDPLIGAMAIYSPAAPPSEAQAQELARALGSFRATGKRIYAYARYQDRLSYLYLASGAELFALDPNGSLALVDIGSFSLYYRAFFEKLGLRFYNLRSHDTKTAFNGFSEYGMSDAERAMKTRYVQGLAGQGYEALRTARQDRLKAGAAELIAVGPYLVPTAARDAGLVDRIMYRDEFEDYLSDELGWKHSLSIGEYQRTRDASWGEHPLAKTVAVLHLSGSIISGPGVAGASIGESAAQRLRELRADPRVRGIILRVDSGGGDAGVSDFIAREVALTVAEGKPVYVSMSGYAASGGYYISAPASRIWAEAGTITGSIGVTGLVPDATELLDKLGIAAESVSAGASADFANPLLPRRQEDADAQAAAIRYIYERFIDAVARGRSMDGARVDELGKGQVWLGSEALENGLVDELGGLSAVKAAMARQLGGPVVFRDERPGLKRGMGILTLLGSRTLAASALPAKLEELAFLAAELEALGAGPLCILPDYLWRSR